MPTENEKHVNAVAPQHGHLTLRVRYISARQPFIDHAASREETLAALKPRVLTFFGLTEAGPGGGTKVYTFAHNGALLADLGATLGSIAERDHELKLDLLERFEQG